MAGRVIVDAPIQGLSVGDAGVRDLLMLSVDREQLGWSCTAGAVAYDVVRGDLHALRQVAGDVSQATQLCVGDDRTLTQYTGAFDPGAGQAVWYLVRPVEPGGNGSYDTGLPGQPASRDAGIAASGNDCP
jgi:hypothetical protein